MKIIKSLIILVVLLLSTGCLNYVELNNIGIINTIGISKQDDYFIININMLTPKENDLEKKQEFETKALSIEEAFDKLYLITEKNINISHLELLILNKTLSKKDYDEIIRFFLRRSDSRNNFNIVILENYSKDYITKYNSSDINELIKTNSNEDGIIIPKTFDEMIEDISNIGISYIPTIKIDKKVEILGYRSIYKEEKLLSKQDSLIYNYIKDKIVKCYIVDKNLNIKIEKNKTLIDINKNVITINIKSTINDFEKTNKNNYKEVLEKYIISFLNTNDKSYFYNLIKKYNYNYYKKNNEIDIKFKIVITVNHNKEVNNIE